MSESQLRAIKSAIKKLLTAASRRQYSGLDFKKQAHTTHRCILHPRSRFRKWWDGFIVLLLLMNLVLVPLHLGFFPTTGFDWALYSLFSDFMLLADMLLNFRTGNCTKPPHSQTILNRKLFLHCTPLERSAAPRLQKTLRFLRTAVECQ
ncbi:potassium/sodium hyperpolarization-activated cyclic nucleotide-gated channel 1-like [Dermacentor silvarum]|uniref:potassium/sodium hyperpolarization-activated cyclic nucleotide-gated channel 1-like n=1 Tax=Dermacentor silvarum TaxID=543639 RepID=UPI0021011851|nr:potassium/sodium hyperpolarization-activated cyclic nucleotide-gated channel 1-like [Dermacentor silvarum]